MSCFCPFALRRVVCLFHIYFIDITNRTIAEIEPEVILGEITVVNVSRKLILAVCSTV